MEKPPFLPTSAVLVALLARRPHCAGWWVGGWGWTRCRTVPREPASAQWGRGRLGSLQAFDSTFSTPPRSLRAQAGTERGPQRGLWTTTSSWKSSVDTMRVSHQHSPL